MLFRFGPFQLNVAARELHGPKGLIHLTPKAFDVLVYLLERPDIVVAKTELLDAFWPLHASEATLQTTLSMIRKALGPDSKDILKTVHGQGVRLISTVTVQDNVDASNVQATSSSIPEQRTVAILYVKLSAQSSAQADNVTSHHAAQTVAAHHGALLHMLLDGFTAIFELGDMQEDAVRRATQCAFALLSADSARGMAIGLSSGTMPKEVGAPMPNWRAPSPIEHEAAAMAHVAKTGEIIATPNAMAHLRDEVASEPCGGGVRVLTPPLQRAGVAGSDTLHGGQFVGRAAELAFLEQAAQSLEQRIGQAISLIGPAGIGKSRLIKEFLAKSQDGPAQAHLLHCLPRGANTPLAPIRALLMQLNIEQCENAEDNALLGRILQDVADPILASLSERILLERSCALVAQFLRAACQVRPLVLVFEDIHWSDASSARHLEALVRACEDCPLLIVLSSRPVESALLTEAALHLSPLGLQDSTRLLQSQPKLADQSQEALQSLAKRGGGNPFFLEELALAYGNVSGTLPETVRAVIEGRVSQLSSRLRQVLYATVIIGPPAAPPVVAHLINQSEDDTFADLLALTRDGFLSQAEGGFACRHMLLNDAAYEMIVEDERKRLHLQVAAYLQTISGDDKVPAEVIAMHLQEGGKHDAAAEQWTRASNAALSRAAANEAVEFAHNGLGLLQNGENPALEMRLHLSLAPALMAARGYGAPEAGDAFQAAHKLNQSIRSDKIAPRILLGLWLHAWVAGDLRDAVGHARALHQIAVETDMPALRLQAHAGIGSVLTHLGEFEAARSELDKGIEVLRQNGPGSITMQNSAVTCVSYAAWNAAIAGRVKDVHAHVAMSEKLSTSFPNPFAQAIHASLNSEAYLMVGDLDASKALSAQAIDISTEYDYPFWLGTSLVLRGWTLVAEQHSEEGLAEIDRGIDIFAATGAGVQLANWYGMKAEALLATGTPQDALNAAQTAARHAAKTEDVWFSARIHNTIANAAAQLGRDDLAHAHQTKGASIAETQRLGSVFVDATPSNISARSKSSRPHDGRSP